MGNCCRRHNVHSSREEAYKVMHETIYNDDTPHMLDYSPYHIPAKRKRIENR